MQPPSPETRLPGKTRPRAWVWFFAFLTAMAAAAVTLPVVYNLSIQLRPGDLAAARARWKASGPRDYDLQYQEKITQNGEQSESEWNVKVRDGKVTAVTCNGEALPAAEYPNLTVEGQFAEIEKGLQLDLAAGRGRTTPRRRSTSATAIRRIMCGGCAARATGWNGTSI